MSKDDKTCEIHIRDQAKVTRIGKEMLEDGLTKDAAQLFKALGDITRLKVLYALSRDELCVCDISALIGKTVSAISHQLRILRNLRLVKYRRDGNIIYYSLADDHISHIITEGLDHVRE